MSAQRVFLSRSKWFMNDKWKTATRQKPKFMTCSQGQGLITVENFSAYH